MKKLPLTLICVLSLVSSVSLASVFVLQITDTVNVFAEEVTVEFRNYDDSFLWKSRVPVGSNVKYEGATPVREPSEDFNYTFVSWDKPLTNVIKDTVFHAQFQNSPKTYSVLFVNYNQKELYSTYVAKGEVPQYLGAVPTRENDEYHTYTFIGWDKEIEATYEDTIYTAQFEAVSSECVVNFRNYNGDLLYSDHIGYGEDAVYRGVMPTRASTDQYEYEFVGWDRSLENVVESFDTYALYAEKEIQFTVQFFNYDGTLLYTDKVAFGSDAKFMAPTPIREPSQGLQYTFVGWSEEITNIQHDLDVFALYESSEQTFTVSFYNYDDTFLYSGTTKYHGSVYYEGKTPSHPDDAKYIYTFIGWDRDITNIEEDIVTYALYEMELRKYTCTFRNYDGEVLYETEVYYGDTAKYIGDTPVRNPDIYSSYKFIGWDQDLENIQGDTTFYAQFERIEGGGGEDKYIMVYFLDYDLTLLDADLVKDGNDAEYYGDTPYRPSENINGNYYYYEFVGWSRSLEGIEKNDAMEVYIFAQYKRNGQYIITYRDPFTLEPIYIDYVSDGGSSSYKGETYDYMSPAYGFVGWDQELVNIHSSLTVFPVFEVEEED